MARHPRSVPRRKWARRLPLMFRRILPLLLALAIVALSTIAFGQPHSRTIVLISTPSEPIDMDRLQETLAAHMSDLDASITVQAVMDLPGDPETRKDVARALIQKTHALCAAWVAPEGETLMLLVSESGAEQMLSRSLSSRPDNVDQVYDAAASIIRAALTPWFYTDDAPPLIPPGETSAAQRPPASESDQSVETETDDASPRTDDQNAKGQFTLSGGYTLDGDFSGTVSHGGTFGLGVLLFQRLLLAADLSIFQAADMNIPEEDIRLLRLPLHLKAALFVNLSRRVLLGIGAALAFDIARVRGADETAAPESIQRMRVGFSPSLLFRIFPIPRLSIDLRSDVDIFGEDHHYRWNGETVLTNGRAHVGGTLGVSFYFPASAPELKR